MRVVTELNLHGAKLTEDQEKAIVDAIGRAIARMDFGEVLGLDAPLKPKDYRIEAPQSPAAIERLCRRAEEIARAERRGSTPEAGPTLRELTAKVREQDQELTDVSGWYAEAENALAEVRKAGWLAWTGWINKKADFPSRMERLRDLCKGRGE